MLPFSGLTKPSGRSLETISFPPLQTRPRLLLSILQSYQTCTLYTVLWARKGGHGTIKAKNSTLFSVVRFGPLPPLPTSIWRTCTYSKERSKSQRERREGAIPAESAEMGGWTHIRRQQKRVGFI
jgi:hypothetical protein